MDTREYMMWLIGQDFHATSVVDLTAEFPKRQPAALALIGGGRLSGEVLRADWEGDDEVAQTLRRVFEASFILPEDVDNTRILRLASRASASLWTASYLESRTVTDELTDHAFRLLGGFLRSRWGDLPPIRERS